MTSTTDKKAPPGEGWSSGTYDNTCAVCGKAIVGVVHCKKQRDKPRDSEEASLGSRICCAHCFEGCEYMDMRTSVERCRFPADMKKEDLTKL